MSSSASGRGRSAATVSAAFALSLLTFLAACDGGVSSRSAAASPSAPVPAAGAVEGGGPGNKGPASALIVPAVERGASRILVVARAASHAAVEEESYVFRLEGLGGGDYYGFSRGRRGTGGEVVESTVRINRFGEEYRATDADDGEGFGMILREGGTVTAFAGSSRIHYSSPAPGSLRVDASEGGHEETVLVSAYGAVYERLVDGQAMERGALDPDGTRYRIRRAEDPEGLDELEYSFQPSGSGLVVGLGSAEPLADFYVEGAEELFPAGEPDLYGLALAELAIGRAWRLLPVLMRAWNLAAGR